MATQSNVWFLRVKPIFRLYACPSHGIMRMPNHGHTNGANPMNTRQTLSVGTRVYDFATEQWATIVATETDEDSTYYKLDASIPLTEEYPSTWRFRGELGLTPLDPHAYIHTPRTVIHANLENGTVSMSEETLH